MKNQTNYKVKVSAMGNITIGNKSNEEVFINYDSAVTYFQEMCEMLLDFTPEVTHNPANPVELSEGGIGYDYRVELEFINE